MTLQPHQYIERGSGQMRTERLIADCAVNFLYNEVLEKAPMAFRALTSSRVSSLLGWLRYDLALNKRQGGISLLKTLGVSTP